jgi:hypothetical protein
MRTPSASDTDELEVMVDVELSMKSQYCVHPASLLCAVRFISDQMKHIIRGMCDTPAAVYAR